MVHFIWIYWVTKYKNDLSEEKVGEERGDYIEERHEKRKLNISNKKEKEKKQRRKGYMNKWNKQDRSKEKNW